MHGTPASDPAVEIRGVTAGYQPDVPVLADFSAVFGGPGLWLIKGGNGAGKSTLLELCSGYLKPWRGSVTVNNDDAGGTEARRLRRVCRTEPALYPHMTVRDHLMFGARCMRADPAPGLDRARDYGLQPWFEYDAKALSTGNRRKLWLIMCSLGEFSVAVLDEPFNGLDGESSERLAVDLKAWATTKLVLLIAHAPPEGITPDSTFMLGGGADETTVRAGGGLHDSGRGSEPQ